MTHTNAIGGTTPTAPYQSFDTKCYTYVLNVLILLGFIALFRDFFGLFSDFSLKSSKYWGS